MRVRPSAMGRLKECASSAGNPEAIHDPASEAQRSGSAAHEGIWHRISTGEDPDLAAVAKKWGLLDDSEVVIPYAMFRRAWTQLEPHFPDPQAELAVTSDLTAGTADLVSIGSDRTSVLDWKTGRMLGSHRYQLMAYAYCLRHEYGMPSEGVIRGATVHLRHEHWTVDEFSDADLDGFAAMVREQVDRIGTHYAAGEHCTFCPSRLGCQTQAAYVRHAIATLSDQEIEPARLAALYPQYKQAMAALEAYKTALNAAVARGPLPMGDGKVLRMQEQTRKSIRPLEAWPVLQEHMTNEELASTIRIGKGAVERIVKDRAARGDKAKSAAALIDRLSEAGAIDEAVFTRLEVVRDDSSSD